MNFKNLIICILTLVDRTATNNPTLLPYSRYTVESRIIVAGWLCGAMKRCIFLWVCSCALVHADSSTPGGTPPFDPHFSPGGAPLFRSSRDAYPGLFVRQLTEPFQGQVEIRLEFRK